MRMRERWLSIALCSLAAALLGSAAQAAEYRPVKKPSDVNLAASMKLWTGLTKGICGAGCRSICVVGKPSEGWPSTVQQALRRARTENVDVLKIKATKFSIAMAVDVLFQKNSVLNHCSRAQVIDSIYKAARGKGRAVYTGDIWGAGRNSAHVTVHDKTNNQLFSIFAGEP